MTVLDDVRALVRRLAPQPVCDDCITKELRLSVRQHANHKTRELARERAFDRRVDRCVRCGKDKTVVRFTAGRPAVR